MSPDITDLLEPYRRGMAGRLDEALDHFDEVVRRAPLDLLRKGFAGMLQSDGIPFDHVMARLCAAADVAQKDSLLRRIAGALPPGHHAGRLDTPCGSPLPLDLVELAQGEHGPGVINALSTFLAEHPGLARTLGAASLAAALTRMADRRRG